MTPQPILPNPPLADRRPTRLEQFGDVRIDDYFWLRQRADPAVMAYLQAENDYTTAAMRHTESLQEQLYQEMRARIKESDRSAPDRLGDYLYYQRTEAGQQYPIYCRRFGQMNAAEEILLDVNQLAAGQPFAEIGEFRVSPDQHWLAYSLDTAGDETYMLYVKNLLTGELLTERIPNTYYGLEWANDNRTIFYTVLDAARRPYRLLRHHLGADPASDQVIHDEPDERFHLHLYKSRSDAFLFFALEANRTKELWFIPADEPLTPPTVISARRYGIEYSVSHHDDRFLITTNEDAQNFRVLTAPVNSLGREGWRELIPYRSDVTITRTDAFLRYLVVHERAEGLRQARIINLETGEDYRIAFPDPVYTFSVGWNPNYASRCLRLTYQSLVTPETVYDFDMEQRTFHLLKQEEVLGGFDPAHYVTTRLWATAADGAQVPVSLVHRRGMRLDGNNPCLLRGYGSYGATMETYFDANRLSLLDRGFVFAMAHIRGGGEMGRAWYEQGKMLCKKNTFTDFTAVAEHLIQQGYTTPKQIVIWGRSAGGLLMGAVTNLRPDLFAGVIAGVPFVDVISTMQDATIPLTVMEYDEWGNPADRTQYAYMRSYSPYDNVEDKAYPHLLVTTGLNDPRVQYWEPAKWVAKLRTLRHNPNLLLLKTNMAAGHAGASGRYDRLRETAFEYAFALKTVGLAAVTE